jgi:peptidoglycan/LPS O-acetylase OafA/YrhL
VGDAVDGIESLTYRGVRSLFATCAVASIATVVQPFGGPVAHLLSLPPLRALGLISYGLYLWHWPVYLVLTPVRTGIDGWPLLALRVAVSLAIPIASYFLCETPIRRGV